MVPLLSLPIDSSILHLFCRNLLLWIKVDRNYHTPIIIVLVSFRGQLELPLIEVQQIVEAIDLLVSLFDSPTPTKFLIRDSLELLQLESGLIIPIPEENY